MRNRLATYKTIGILAITQILSWGMLYYTFTIIAADIQKETGWRAEWIFGAFSWCLLVAGFFSTPVGIQLDKRGGRLMMSAGSLVCGLGLLLLSYSHTIGMYFVAWTVLGLAMSLTLYEAAFATINHEFIQDGRRAISTLTLFGGFASTIFWPLTLHLKSTWNWREILLIYAALQILICFPLHILLKPKHALPKTQHAGEHKSARSHTLKEALQHPAFWKLALAFATNSFVFSALSVHLIPMLINMGHPAAMAVFLAAWIGPMQVAGRIGEMTFAKHALPQTVGKFVFSALPAALLALLLLGQQQWVVAVFCVLYGLSNGIITIVRGTIPQALFGRENYGAISGAMAGPALVSKAAGPLILAALMQMQGSVSPLLTLLLACSSISLLFYFSAVKSAAATEGIQTIKA